MDGVCVALGLLAALAAVPGVAHGQQASPGVPAQQQESGYSLRVNSQLVVLDVVVTGKDGKNVRHLTKDDFTVYENKVPQTIKSLEEVTPPAAAAAIQVHSTEELDKLEPNAPVSVIVIDELTTQFADLAFARYSLKKYLNAQGDTLQQPTMLVAANYDNVAMLHDYTTSRQEILDALDHHLGSVNSVTRAQQSSWMNEQINGAFASVVGVAEAAAGHPGHKNLIWVGRGFPSIDPSTLDGEQRAALDKAIASCTNLLRDARVTLYSIDPAGLSASSPAQDQDGYETDPFGGQIDFDTMVTATGGLALHGRNDVDRLIDEAVRDGESFYTLSYAPSASSQDPQKFRNIRVVMKDRSLQASTRQGYFAHDAAVEPALGAKGDFSHRLVFDLNVAGSNLMVYDGIPITAIRDAKSPDHFVLRVPASSLMRREDANQEAAKEGNVELTVAAETFDRKGKLLNKHVQLVKLLVPAPENRSGGSATVDVAATVATQPPAARVRLIVRDNASGKIGADNFFLVDRKSIADPATGLNTGGRAYK
jgi:VWFA-related protein